MAVNIGEIFSVIGADTTPLSKSQQKVDRLTRKMEDDLLGVSKQADGTSKSFQAFASKLEGVGTKIRGVGASLTALTAPMAAFGAISLKASMDFSRGMAEVSTLIPGQRDRIKDLSNSVKELAKTYGKGTQDITSGLYQVISAFGDTSDTVKILDINVRAAKAGMAATKEAIDLTSAVTKGYGDTTAKAVKHASDLAFKTVELGQTTFPELARAIGKVVPQAVTLGVTQEELFAQFATLTGVTGSTAEVSTQLRSAYMSLLDPSKELATALQSTAIQMMEQGKIGGPLVDNYVNISKALQNTYNWMNTLEQAGRKNTQEYKEQKDILKSLEKQYKQATAGLVPLIVQGQGVQKTFQDITAAAGGNSSVLTKMLGRVEALTAVLSLSGTQADTYAQKFDKMTKAVGATDTAYKEMTEGVGKTVHTWDQLKSEFEVLRIEIGDELAPVFYELMEDVLKPLIKDNLTPLIKSFSELDNGTKQLVISLMGLSIAIGPILLGVGQMLTLIGGLGKLLIPLSGVAFPALVKVLGGLATLIGGAITTVLTALVGTFGAVILAVGSVGLAVYQLIKHWEDLKLATKYITYELGVRWNKFKEDFTLYLKGCYYAGKEWLVNKYADIKMGIWNFINDTINYWASVPGRIVIYFQEIYYGARDWLVNKFFDMFNWIQARIEDLRLAWLGLKESLVGNSIIPDMISEIGHQFSLLEKVMVKPTEKYLNDVVQIYDKTAKRIAKFKVAPGERQYTRLADALALTQGIPVEKIGPVADVGLQQLVDDTEYTQGIVESFVNTVTYLFSELTNSLSFDVQSIRNLTVRLFQDMATTIQSSMSISSSTISSGFSYIVSVIFNAVQEVTTSVYNMNTSLGGLGEGLEDQIWENISPVIAAGGPLDQLKTGIADKAVEISGALDVIGITFYQSFVSACNDIVAYFGNNFTPGIATKVDDFLVIWSDKIRANTGDAFYAHFKQTLDQMVTYFDDTFQIDIIGKMDEFLSDWSDKTRNNTGDAFYAYFKTAVENMRAFFNTQFNTSGSYIRGAGDTFLNSYWVNFTSSLITAWENALTFIATGSYSGGGMVTGYSTGGTVGGPGGIDNVPAWLTKGEVVISKPAVDYYGKDILLALNAMQLAGGGLVEDGIIPTLNRTPNDVFDMPCYESAFRFATPWVQRTRSFDHNDNLFGNVKTDYYALRTAVFPDGAINKNGEWQGRTTYNVDSDNWSYNGRTGWRYVVNRADILGPGANMMLDHNYLDHFHYPSHSYGLNDYEMANYYKDDYYKANGDFDYQNKGWQFNPLYSYVAPTSVWHPSFFDYMNNMGINLNSAGPTIPGWGQAMWANPEWFHQGGYVGGGLINTIPDEFMIQPSGVRKYGTDMLEDINEGRYSGNPIIINVTVEGNIIDNPSERRRFAQGIYDEIQKIEGRMR